MMRALVRSIPSSFSQALCAVAPEPPIDVALARGQHAAYCAALAACGAAVETVAGDDGCPDCCFIEDTAVVVGDRALVTRPGAPSRRAETPAVAAALGRWLEVVAMTEPATLDGGDCLQVGGTVYVGRSERTNSLGIAQLSALGLRVVPVELPRGVLHLKCVCWRSGMGGSYWRSSRSRPACSRPTWCGCRRRRGMRRTRWRSGAT